MRELKPILTEEESLQALKRILINGGAKLRELEPGERGGFYHIEDGKKVYMDENPIDIFLDYAKGKLPPVGNTAHTGPGGSPSYPTAVFDIVELGAQALEDNSFEGENPLGAAC